MACKGKGKKGKQPFFNYFIYLFKEAVMPRNFIDLLGGPDEAIIAGIVHIDETPTISEFEGAIYA